MTIRSKGDSGEVWVMGSRDSRSSAGNINRPAARQRLKGVRHPQGSDDDDGDWSAWLARHGAAAVLFARQWAPIPADAEDAVQEAFVRFWRSRTRAQDPAAYLYACVKRCAIDADRSKRRR